MLVTSLIPCPLFILNVSKFSFYLFIFQLLGECHCCWTKESPEAHVAKFYGRLRLICNVVKASKFSVLKLIEIVILWVYYTIPFGLSFFGTFGALFFTFFNYFLWLRITDEDSIPEMCIWSILLIKSDLKWCINHSRRLYLYFEILQFIVKMACKHNRSTEGCSNLKRSVDMTSSGKNGLNIRTNARWLLMIITDCNQYWDLVIMCVFCITLCLVLYCCLCDIIVHIKCK